MTTTAPEVQAELIPIYVMGKRYLVPDSLTIMKAMEYAGYQFIRGCGCRGGICGACSTVYRKEGDYKIYTGLACQTVVEQNMHLTQLPFYPALRTPYDYAEAEPAAGTLHALYPEVFRCVACNACTKVCPMDVEVMDYIAAVKRGDLRAAKEISFDCIQCGLCASRCMGELPQYHIAQVARRLYGGKIEPPADHLRSMVDDIAAGKFDSAIQKLKALKADELRKVYSDREMEPAMTGEDWRPKENTGL
ncbi:MAG: 4Fe-4S dicluster domain-containing protein [Deltaproteobacteria bacterium]|nr:4Fe-4S dicluster domain-containing protein [Deltaproteobacteria bacterium]MBW2535559.1 4Fe-4S dicluster domain-containing protein [Deltaproteobacteria bacterium]